MKLLSFLFLILTAVSIYIPYSFVQNNNQPKQINLTSDQTYNLYNLVIITNNDKISLKSSSYFEVSQEETVITPQLENPEIGKDAGQFWVRDLPLTEEFTINIGAANIYYKSSQIRIVPTDDNKHFFRMVGVMLGVMLWLCSILLLIWVYNHFIYTLSGL